MRFTAFLRGINAGVTMKMADLRQVFADLGFQDVKTIIASGNVVFTADTTDKAELEKKIEAALLQRFAANISTILLTKAELQRLIDSTPFRDIEITPQTKPYVTFLPRHMKVDMQFPVHSPQKGYTILGIYHDAVCSVVDLTGSTTPDLMKVLDDTFGKEITTRGWPTLEKVLKAAGGDS